MQAGLPLSEIYDLPLDVFRMYLATHQRLEAQRRLVYIGDTVASVATVLSSKDPLKDYRKALETQALGEEDG